MRARSNTRVATGRRARWVPLWETFATPWKRYGLPSTPALSLGAFVIHGGNRRRARRAASVAARDMRTPLDSGWCVVAHAPARGEAPQLAEERRSARVLEPRENTGIPWRFALGRDGTSRAVRPWAMTRVAPPTHPDHDWSNVSELRPCPVCGSPSGCSVHADGAFASCSREQSEWPLTNGSWLHRVALVDSVITRSPAAIVADAATTTKAWVASTRP